MNPHDQPIAGRRTRPRAQSSATMSAHDSPSQLPIVTTLEDRDSKRRKVDDPNSESVEPDTTESLPDGHPDEIRTLATQSERIKISGSDSEEQVDSNAALSSNASKSETSTSTSSDMKPSSAIDNMASSSGTTESTPAFISPSEDPLFSPRARAQELISRVSLELERDNARLPRMDYVDPSPMPSLFNDISSSVPRAEHPSESSRDQQEPLIETPSLAPPSSEEHHRPASQNPQPSPSPIQRIPTGTSLIVQGLVQTVARPRSSNTSHHHAHSSASTSSSRSFFNRPTGHGSRQVPVFGTRRSADRGAAGTAHQDESSEEDSDGMPSFEEQASLIGGLLSMATTATARSLLSTTTDPSANNTTTESSSISSDPVRSGLSDESSRQLVPQTSHRLPSRFASVVDGIQRRLHSLRNASPNIPSPSSRPHTAPSVSSDTDTSPTLSDISPQEEGIERVLRRFMTEAFERQDRSRVSSVAPTRSPLLGGRSNVANGDSAEETSSESDQRLFETFLSGLQPSLVEALMEFNDNSPEGEAGGSGTETVVNERSTPLTESRTGTRETEAAENSSSNSPDVNRTEGQEEGERRMNWMRVHRFSPRIAPAIRANGGSSDNSSDIPASVSPSTSGIERADRVDASHVSGSDSTNQGNDPPDENNTSNVSGERTVVPLIMVGVRSVRNQDIPGIFASTTANGSQPSATAARAQRTTAVDSNSNSIRPSRQETRTDRSRNSINIPVNPTRPRPSPYASSLPARLLRGRNSQTTPTSMTPERNIDAVMSDRSSASQPSTSYPRPSGFALLRRALSGIIGNGATSSSSSSSQTTEPSIRSSATPIPVETTTTTSDSSSETIDVADDTEVRRSNSFILWVIGGLYAPDHPILTAPGLFTGHLDHDDLWALAELLGQTKPPTATTTEINSSGLAVVRGSEISSLVKLGRIHMNTSDRCAVCLDDYEDEVECRIMSCKHVFHKECIDKWLSVGRNACPACRTKGVKVQADEPEPSTTSPSASENPTPFAS